MLTCHGDTKGNLQAANAACEAKTNKLGCV